MTIHCQMAIKIKTWNPDFWSDSHCAILVNCSYPHSDGVNSFYFLQSGDKDTDQEAEKYEQMENNYNLVFGKSKEKSKDEL